MIKFFLEQLKKQGMTQQQIAEKAGISQNMVSSFLNGKSCTVETLKKIAKAFGVTTDHVLGIDQPEKPEPPKPRRLGANTRHP